MEHFGQQKVERPDPFQDPVGNCRMIVAQAGTENILFERGSEGVAFAASDVMLTIVRRAQKFSE